jgi:type II secretory pathway component PulF
VKFTSTEKWYAKAQFDAKKRISFYNQLISLVSTGMSKPDAIRMAWSVASQEGRKPKSVTAIVLHEVLLSLKNGESLAASLKPWVPLDDVMVFEAIENLNDFCGNLQTYLEMTEKRSKIKMSIIGGMLYPLFLTHVLFFMMYYFGTTVVPKISPMLPVEEWTGPAIFLRFLFHFAQDVAIPLAASAVILLIAVIFSLPRLAGGIRERLDKLPIYATYRMYTGISFLMSMASLMEGGVTPVNAIDRLRPASNAYVALRLQSVRNALLNGLNLGAALHHGGKGWPDPEMNLAIKVFAETQDLSKQMTRLSKSWMDDSQRRIDGTMAVLKIAALIAVFIVLMGIVGGIYSLQSQITESVQRF